MQAQKPAFLHFIWGKLLKIEGFAKHKVLFFTFILQESQ